MSEPEAIAARVAELLASASGALGGKHVLVSAGGTREPLDSVRFLGNRSSGRMGVALAAEARRRGATVTLLAANLAVSPPDGVAVVEVPTAADMEREALARRDADVVLMAAAVADYRPAAVTYGKRAKTDERWDIELVPTVDVLRALGAAKENGQLLVAFGAEHGAEGLERKRRLLTDKNADLVVFNDVGRDDIGFDAGENEVTLIARDGETHVAKASKAVVAAAILDEVERLLGRA
jgi:phosphopantothenoylcysteine decarboxylase/phosphopantothenate--cysteine ligase